MVESVGRKLQQARLARKLEIEDVAERTKIRPDRIIDLEADEYSHFPNLTYAKSFLAKYARFLGVDIQEELDRFQISPAISMGDYQYLEFVSCPESCAATAMDAENPAKRVSSSPGGGHGPGFDRAGGGSGIFVFGAQHPEGGGNQFGRHDRQTQSIGCRAGQSGASRRRWNPIHSSLWRRNLPPQESAAAIRLRLQPGSEGGCDSGAVRRWGRSQTGAAGGRLSIGDPGRTPLRTSLSTLPEKKLEVRVIRRTYVKVTKDEEGTQPVFEGFAAPDSRPIVVEGKRFWVHALDKGAVEVREDGQLVPGNSGDIVID